MALTRGVKLLITIRFVAATLAIAVIHLFDAYKKKRVRLPLLSKALFSSVNQSHSMFQIYRYISILSQKRTYFCIHKNGFVQA